MDVDTVPISGMCVIGISLDFSSFSFLGMESTVLEHIHVTNYLNPFTLSK